MTFGPGFDSNEAKAFIAICSALNGQVEDAPTPPLPADWSLSPPVEAPSLLNAYQIGESKSQPGVYLIAWRGTMTVLRSELEDFAFIPVSAEGYARDPRARLHIGFKEGFETLRERLVSDVQSRAAQAPAGAPVRFYIAGHSQGGAVAAVCAAFLRNATFPGAERLQLKTYCFAQPKPGNYYFACDFNQARYSAANMTFVVNSDQDFVPQIPLTIQVVADLNNGARYVMGARPPEWLKLLFDLKFPVSLDFAPAGAPVILPGHAAPDQEKNDFFYQHHAGRYWELLCEQFPSRA